jgi:hypothetical protein
MGDRNSLVAFLIQRKFKIYVRNIKKFACDKSRVY